MNNPTLTLKLLLDAIASASKPISEEERKEFLRQAQDAAKDLSSWLESGDLPDLECQTENLAADWTKTSYTLGD